MSTFIDYAKSLMETAKGFAEKGKTEENEEKKQAYLRAAILHVFSFLEAHLNEIADHFADHFVGSSTLTVHEQGVLRERDVRLVNGRFELGDSSKFHRLTDRIDLLLGKFGDGRDAYMNSWYSDLMNAIKIRNSIVHPKDIRALQHAEVIKAISSVIECTDTLYKVVFKKGLPYKGKSIEGKLIF